MKTWRFYFIFSVIFFKKPWSHHQSLSRSMKKTKKNWLEHFDKFSTFIYMKHIKETSRCLFLCGKECDVQTTSLRTTQHWGVHVGITELVTDHLYHNDITTFASETSYIVTTSFWRSWHSAWPFVHWHHCVEVVAALSCDRDLLPDVGQQLQIWEQITWRHNEV